MALDYLTIPRKPLYLMIKLSCLAATSVDVERVFSQGRLILSHVQCSLSVQSTCALMCLGVWSQMGLVKDSDITAVTVLPEVEGEEEELEWNWDSILS